MDTVENILTTTTKSSNSTGTTYSANNLASARGLIFDKDTASKYELNYINRVRTIVPGNILRSGTGYLFVTKPDLNLMDDSSTLNEDLENRDYFVNSFYYKKELMEELQTSIYTNNNRPFINLMVNRFSGFEIPDITLKSAETVETFRGWKLTYAKHSVESRTGFNTTLTFNEKEDLHLTHLFKIWTDYIELLDKGLVGRRRKYMKSNVLDYATAAYYIVVGSDGETILYYAKVIGFFPLKQNNSIFNSDENNSIQIPLKLSVDFVGSMVESLEPDIISEFNQLTTSSGKTAEMPTYLSSDKYDFWTSSPYITSSNGVYRLKFNKGS